MMTTPRGRARRAPMAGFVAAAAAIGASSLLPAIPAGAASNQLTVSAQTIGNKGKVLVVKGKAAYTLAPGSTCTTAACLKVWSPVTLPATVTTATAGTGVQASKLGVTTGPGGANQVTYNGQPIFWFYKDKKGTLKGNVKDQWGKWAAVVVVKPKHGSSGSGSGSNSNTGSSGANAGGGGVNF